MNCSDDLCGMTVWDRGGSRLGVIRAVTYEGSTWYLLIEEETGALINRGHAYVTLTRPKVEPAALTPADLVPRSGK